MDPEIVKAALSLDEDLSFTELTEYNSEDYQEILQEAQEAQLGLFGMEVGN